MPSVGDIVDYLERFAPPSLAGGWDNVGLLLGERGGDARRVMTCLTVTPEVVAEAVREEAQLIVSHHPVLFRGAKRLSDGTAEGRLLLPLLRAGIAVHSPHTAFDNTAGGINDLLAGKLGLREVRPLRPQPAAGGCKLVVFVPEGDLARVSDAMFAAGAGQIGDYRECSFRVPGTGTFFGLEPTSPAVGQKGRREEVAEWRLEVVCPAGGVERIVAAMRRAHSYEEPAFDVYPLQGLDSGRGEGRIGVLPQAHSLAQLARLVKSELRAAGVQVVGSLERSVERVAIVCGAGGEMLPDARKAGAEVFLTGEARFHDCLAAREQGLALILPGHHATERPGVEMLAARLHADWPGIEFWASRSETDPLAWL